MCPTDLIARSHGQRYAEDNGYKASFCEPGVDDSNVVVVSTVVVVGSTVVVFSAVVVGFTVVSSVVVVCAVVVVMPKIAENSVMFGYKSEPQ